MWEPTIKSTTCHRALRIILNCYFEPLGAWSCRRQMHPSHVRQRACVMLRSVHCCFVLIYRATSTDAPHFKAQSIGQNAKNKVVFFEKTKPHETTPTGLHISLQFCARRAQNCPFMHALTNVLLGLFSYSFKNSFMFLCHVAVALLYVADLL